MQIEFTNSETKAKQAVSDIVLSSAIIVGLMVGVSLFDSKLQNKKPYYLALAVCAGVIAYPHLKNKIGK